MSYRSRGRIASRAGVVLLTVLMVVGGASGGAGQPLQRERSVWDGPWNPSISEPEVEQFVQLWSARVPDESWFGPYLEADEIPQRVRDEGFHDLDVHTKFYLTHRLFERLVLLMPSLATDVAKAGADRREVDRQKEILYLFVFEKSWIKRLRAKDPSRRVVEKSKGLAVSPELRRSIDALSVVPAIPVARAPETKPPVAVTRTASAPALPRHRGLERLLAVKAATPAAPEPERTETTSTTPFGVGTYRLCSASPTKARECSVDLPVGTPSVADVDGDLIPDVLALLVIAPGTDLNSITATFEVRRLVPGAPLPGYVTAVQDVFLASKSIEFGFESPASLANVSHAEVTLKDIAQAVAGKILIGAKVTYDTPSAPSGLRFRTANQTWVDPLTPVESSPTQGTLLFNPAVDMQADLTLNRMPGQDEYTLQYVASGPSLLTGQVDVYGLSGALSRRINATVANLPASATVRFSKDAAGGVTVQYAASAAIASTNVVDTAYQSASTYTTTSLTATGIPANITVAYAPPRRVVYASSATTTLITVSRRNVVSGSEESFLSAQVTGLPQNVTVDANGMLPASGSASTLIYQASATTPNLSVLYTKNTGESFGGAVSGLPASVTLTLDMVAQRIGWTASGVTPAAVGQARIKSGGKTWDAGVTLSGIPASWEGLFTSGHFLFRGISGPLGNVSGFLTNHGSYLSLPGNHASINLASNGNLDGSFSMAQVNLADVIKTATGYTGDLRMGGGGLLALRAEVYSGATVAFASASINPLPTSIQFSQSNDEMNYTSNANFDLGITSWIGNTAGVANAPIPPPVTGLAVRDGYGCAGSVCGVGYFLKATIFGFPTGLSFRPAARTFQVTNFRPGVNSSLTLDVDLDNAVSPRTRLLATQSGIPSPINFTFGPVQTTSISGGKETTASYTASAAMGALTATIERGTDAGSLSVSNIPSSISATIRIVDGTSQALVTTSSSITNITAQFRRTSDVTFQAAVSLSQIPTSVDLSFGRISVTQGSNSFTVPGLRYRANADTLDVSAFANATLFGGNLQAAVSMLITNLGRTVDMFLNGTTLQAVSSPATSGIEIHTWGRINYMKTFGGCVPSSCPTFRIEYGGHAGVVPLTINDLGIAITNLSSLNIRLGITSGIDGNYGTFRFGWASMSVTIDVEASASACVTGWCLTIISATIHVTDPSFNVVFHLGTNHYGGWYHISTPVPCDLFPPTAYDIHVDINPHKHSTPVNGFTVAPPGAAEGNAWTVTPDPEGIVPDLAVDVAAALTSPYGGGFSISFPCH